MNRRFPLTDEQRAKAVDTVMQDVDDDRPRVRQAALRTVVQMERLNRATTSQTKLQRSQSQCQKLCRSTAR